MRPILVPLILLLAAGPATAHDLSQSHSATKGSAHILDNPGQPDGRDGGETMADAITIYALPFSDTGNTSDNVDDYDAVCPYSGSTSPDVVYACRPNTHQAIYVDLCGSLYDTKAYIMDADQNVIACNDDYYFDSYCGMYVSYIDMAFLEPETTYYIVIDGYGGDAGEYLLEVYAGEYPHPCTYCGDGLPEGEPELQDGYIDLFNSGCNDESGLYPFQHLEGTGGEYLTFCGLSGWYDQNTRDTDWFTVTLGSTGVLEWTLIADHAVYGFLLGPQDCSQVAVVEILEAPACSSENLSLTGAPGETLWLWVGPMEFTPPAGFIGHEFMYVCDFAGIADGVVATEGMGFDRLKSLYR